MLLTFCCSLFLVRSTHGMSVAAFFLSLVVTSSHFFRHFISFSCCFHFFTFEIGVQPMMIQAVIGRLVHFSIFICFSHLSFWHQMWHSNCYAINFIELQPNGMAMLSCPRNLPPVQKPNQYAHMNIFIDEVDQCHSFAFIRRK